MKKGYLTQITTGGVLLRRSRVLLIQRAAKEKVLPNLWELPSGKKKVSETVEQAVVREFKEETSLKVKIIKPISVFTYRLVENGRMVYSRQINFLVKYAGCKIKVKLSPAHQAYKWVGRKDLKNLKLSAKLKQVLALVNLC